jgi:methylmalonyl-CoA/ethylmalonyl-CoA epimerase
MIKKINHVAIAVPDVTAAQAFWVDALGLSLSHTAQVPEEGVDVAFLTVGDGNIELLEPVAADTGVARFLEKRGPGIHHICLEVDDIDTMLARLKEHEVRLINEQAVVGHGGRRYAFVHPQGTGGVLVELYQMEIERLGD